MHKTRISLVPENVQTAKKAITKDFFQSKQAEMFWWSVRFEFSSNLVLLISVSRSPHVAWRSRRIYVKKHQCLQCDHDTALTDNDSSLRDTEFYVTLVLKRILTKESMWNVAKTATPAANTFWITRAFIKKTASEHTIYSDKLCSTEITSENQKHCTLILPYIFVKTCFVHRDRRKREINTPKQAPP